jgi:tRNA pseudouridine55 synthase
MIGFLFIDKPAGITSHDVIDRLRRKTGIKRIGHAGTLDPFATGLLVVGVSREATREMQKIQGLDKSYEATFVFGGSSDTDDIDGVITKVDSNVELTKDLVQEASKAFIGEIDQVPPNYSAIKVKGKKLYELARAGKEIEVKSRKVTIRSIEVGEIEKTEAGYEVKFTITCSTGTYIRAIARDIGEKLKTGGYVKTLRRTSVGPFLIDEAKLLENLTKDNWNLSLNEVDSVLNRL